MRIFFAQHQCQHSLYHLLIPYTSLFLLHLYVNSCRNTRQCMLGLLLNALFIRCGSRSYYLMEVSVDMVIIFLVYIMLHTCILVVSKDNHFVRVVESFLLFKFHFQIRNTFTQNLLPYLLILNYKRKKVNNIFNDTKFRDDFPYGQ